MSEPRSTRAEDDARHLEAHALKRSGLPPAYRPLRARLLVQVEDREPTPVCSFEPRTEERGGETIYRPVWPKMLEVLLLAALTVECREALAEQERNRLADEFGECPVCRNSGQPCARRGPMRRALAFLRRWLRALDLRGFGCGRAGW